MVTDGQGLSALNHRRELRGGDSKPQVFECSDARDWVLKLLGNPLGPTSLVADWVGTAIGRLIAVPVPECSIATVSKEAIETAPEGVQEWALPGPALATEYVTQSSNVSGVTALFTCNNLSELGSLVVLDTWIETLDRRKPDGSWNLLIDCSGSGTRVLVIDQGFSLTEPLRSRGALPLGSAPEQLRCPTDLEPLVDWRNAVDSVSLMMAITVNELRAVVASIPNEWLSAQQQRGDIVDYLSQRRELVARLVRERSGRS